MKIIGICGEIGAGKDSFADYLVNKKGYKKVVMSDMITNEIKNLGRGINREEMVRTGQEYREKHGKGIWAKMSIEFAKHQGYRRVVISGVRDIEEVQVFKKLLGKDFLLIYITADKEIRQKRIIARKGPKDPKTIEEVEMQEQKENEVFSLNGHFNEYADVRITNNAMLVELWANADLILKERGFEAKEF